MLPESSCQHTQKILFQGPSCVISNMYHGPGLSMGESWDITHPSSEHAYKYTKTSDIGNKLIQDDIWQSTDGVQAKALSTHLD